LGAHWMIKLMPS